MPLVEPEHRWRSAVKHGWTRLLGAARPRRRFSIRRRARHHEPGASGFSAAPSVMPLLTIDPVALTVLAVSRLGPATLCTVAHGKRLTVTVPSARIGEIFRAALAEMQKTHLTDRLIAITVDDTADASPSSTRA
jgi:hypothetical protein